MKYLYYTKVKTRISSFLSEMTSTQVTSTTNFPGVESWIIIISNTPLDYLTCITDSLVKNLVMKKLDGIKIMIRKKSIVT